MIFQTQATKAPSKGEDMARMIYTDCVKCGVRFEWELHAENDPVCKRCADITGNDIKKVLSVLGESNVPGQKSMLHALNLMLERIEKLEAASGAVQVEAKKGFLGR
jgi:hypothetical protein